ncbi:MAG: hypothetical protein HOO03_10310 [Rhodobacteraceae bacterium]|jgi:hypothetical protein|nr:hypothetical protein [Paracoccaceae bacterium]MBT4778620.1 hypothetical protein [Paracoccaceae bacterium]MBT6272381.1 hypothetical protein [Paracoccaceae bacterium]MBT6437132.1 hypothetical protein [Paracoccaceae bacterium]MDG1299684.1 hypothetical protein [Paracoccaceae bacterium]|tara:strand:- start:598 stop:903 length:306 start_codon:yes stop_codon:yes gene_type:complete
MSAKNIHVLRKYQDERRDLVNEWLNNVSDAELNWVKDPTSPEEELKSVLSKDYTAISCEQLGNHIWEHMDTKPFLIEAYEDEPEWSLIREKVVLNDSIFDD